MTAAWVRGVVRVVTLVVATAALTLSGGAPSWTDSVQPRPERVAKDAPEAPRP